MKDRLDEYLDGLLPPAEEREIAEALARDADLRAACEKARGFRGVLEEMASGEREVERIVARVRRAQRRRTVLRRAAAAAAAALLFWSGAQALFGPRTHEDRVNEVLAREATEFGRRLGAMAAARRDGRVPRVGAGDLEVPPAALFGVVFKAALDELDVPLPAGTGARVLDAVSEHFRATWPLKDDVAGQTLRSEGSLQVFRRLRSVAGTDVADAFYDVFRPGVADLETARRVPAGALATVLADPATRARYMAEYEHAVRLLERRYGRPQVQRVLARLAPTDRRHYWRDAAEDGVGRDAILSIRALLYRAAAQAGVDRLYVEEA